jgi:uncharacterized DUF497 family protein
MATGDWMILRVEDFVWPDWVLDKTVAKHGVEPDEVEQVFFNPPYKVRRSDSGKYLLYGRSEGGRYLFVVSAWDGGSVRIISARDMTGAERRYWERK